jgi:hypothetical protein
MCKQDSTACKDLKDPCCEVRRNPHGKEMKKEVTSSNKVTSKKCFSVAHAFTPTIGIAFCNMVVITAKMHAQVQTKQKKGTAQLASTSLRNHG